MRRSSARRYAKWDAFGGEWPGGPGRWSGCRGCPRYAVRRRMGFGDVPRGGSGASSGRCGKHCSITQAERWRSRPGTPAAGAIGVRPSRLSPVRRPEPRYVIPPALVHLGRAARLLPGGVPALDVAYPFEPDPLRHLGRERRAPVPVAVEREPLVLFEDLGFVIRALRIDPELHHPARHVEGPRDPALALQLAHVAQVHEDHLRIPVHRDRFRHGTVSIALRASSTRSRTEILAFTVMSSPPVGAYVGASPSRAPGPGS